MTASTAPSAAESPRRSATATPATGCDCPPGSADGCGCVSTAETRPSDVERRLSAWAVLLREAARKRLLRRVEEAQRQHKATSSIRKALAAATLEALRCE
jgi:hypothetical protein